MMQTDLTDFGNRYAAAWSSQDPASLTSFYAENGSLMVNGGPPSVGRAAVEETASSFMTAFPDMVVKMTRMELASSSVWLDMKSGQSIETALLQSQTGTTMKRNTSAS